MKLIYLLEPADYIDQIPVFPALPNGDFIEYFYHKRHVTYTWNKFALKPEIVQKYYQRFLPSNVAG
jgi:hypothetical protein